MRPLKITKPRPEALSQQLGQVDTYLALWTALGATGLSGEGIALPKRLADKGRFVVALAQQYQRPSLRPERLIKVAHEVLITLLNRYAHQPDQLDKLLPLALRNAMVTASQDPTTH